MTLPPHNLMNPTVPWNASWTGESVYEIRPCRWAGGQLAVWQPHNPGSGRPIFAKPHFVRQRRSIYQMVCTVCGVHTTHRDRWWFALGEPLDGRWFATTEAPVHKACGEHAMVVCPHIKKGAAANFSPLPRGFHVLSTVVGGDLFEKDFGLKTGGRQVIGGLKLAWPINSIRFAGPVHG